MCFAGFPGEINDFGNSFLHSECQFIGFDPGIQLGIVGIILLGDSVQPIYQVKLDPLFGV